MNKLTDFYFTPFSSLFNTLLFMPVSMFQLLAVKIKIINLNLRGMYYLLLQEAWL